MVYPISCNSQARLRLLKTHLRGGFDAASSCDFPAKEGFRPPD